VDLVKCKDTMEHHQTNKVFKFILERWAELEEVLKILKVFYDVTIKLQKFDCTLSDFYGDWLLAELKLKRWIERGNSTTNLSEKLLWSMDKRKNDIINHSAMLCAIFLDPRFKSNLSISEVALVKHLLENMWLEVKKKKSTEIAHAGDNVFNASDDDLLESFLAESRNNIQTTTTRDIIQTSGIPDYTKSAAQFMVILNEYECSANRMHHSESIRAFWEENKILFPELYEVAKIYLAIPPTQATVERSFSTLSFIYNNRRSSLGKNLLENIILIKLNKEIALDIFSEELNEI
jgi:hypothetical protein